MTDPHFARLLELMASVDLTTLVHDPQVAARLADHLNPQPADYQPPQAETRDVLVAGPHGDIPVRVYSRGPGADRPLLVFCHGGGWIQGDLDMPEADATARELVRRLDVVIVSVDYRLAVESVTFPVPLDDVEAAYHWAKDADLGTGRVFVGGGSAGANLVAGLVVRLRETGHPLPDGQVLIYPLVHPVVPAASPELAAKTAGLSPMAAFAPEILTPLVENYLGCPVSQATGQAMAALSESQGLPPALILNCEYDGLRASGEAYAAQLANAGVDVEVHCAPDVLHGHLNLPWLPQAQRDFDLVTSWIQRRQDAA